MKKVEKHSILYPDYIAKSVLELKPSDLKKIGVKYLVFDIDETLVPNRKNSITDEYAKFLRSLEKAGFKILIGSNSRRDFSNITKHFNTRVVKPGKFAFKPLKGYYSRIVDAAKVDAHEIAMVGDRILNDVIGGNISKFTTILVEPYIQKRGKIHKAYIKRTYGKTT